jgi:hypothetical protein
MTVKFTIYFLKVTANRIAVGKWGCNNGQACVAPDFIITTNSIAPKLVINNNYHSHSSPFLHFQRTFFVTTTTVLHLCTSTALSENFLHLLFVGGFSGESFAQVLRERPAAVVRLVAHRELQTLQEVEGPDGRRRDGFRQGRIRWTE